MGGSGGGSEAGLGNKLIVGHCICKEPAFRVPRKKVSLVTNFVWFYLQQNDVLYVEPNRTKMRNSRYSAMTGQVLTGTSVLVSVAGLIVTLTKK